MWGPSSPSDKLTGDFGNEPDATSISDRGLFRLLARNLSPGVFRLLQHNRHIVPVGGRNPFGSGFGALLSRAAGWRGRPTGRIDPFPSSGIDFAVMHKHSFQYSDACYR